MTLRRCSVGGAIFGEPLAAKPSPSAPAAVTVVAVSGGRWRTLSGSSRARPLGALRRIIARAYAAGSDDDGDADASTAPPPPPRPVSEKAMAGGALLQRGETFAEDAEEAATADVTFDDPRSWQARTARDFATLMALCHTVVVQARSSLRCFCSFSFPRSFPFFAPTSSMGSELQ